MSGSDAGTGGPEHEELVQQVKALQRESEESKTSWHDYCDAVGGGIRDPKRHPTDFLQQFFEAYRSGNVPTATAALHTQPLPPAGTGDPKEVLELLIAKVKHGQRTSSAWKEAWWNYCDKQKEGVRDPARHDAESLRYFLEEVAAHVNAGGGASSSRDPEDRDRGRRGGGGAAPTAEASALAERVKQLQRKSEASKQHWAWYCDTFGGGVRDPARHQAHFLQQYLSTAEGGGTGEKPRKERNGRNGSGGSSGAFGKASGAAAAAPGHHYHPYDQSYPSGAPGGPPPPAGHEARPYGPPPAMPPWGGYPGYPGYPPPAHPHQAPGYPPPMHGYPPPPAYGYGPGYGYPPAAYPGYGPPAPGYGYGYPPPQPYGGYKADAPPDPHRRY